VCNLWLKFLKLFKKYSRNTYALIEISLNTCINTYFMCDLELLFNFIYLYDIVWYMHLKLCMWYIRDNIFVIISEQLQTILTLDLIAVQYLINIINDLTSME